VALCEAAALAPCSYAPLFQRACLDWPRLKCAARASNKARWRYLECLLFSLRERQGHSSHTARGKRKKKGVCCQSACVRDVRVLGSMYDHEYKHDALRGWTLVVDFWGKDARGPRISTQSARSCAWVQNSTPKEKRSVDDMGVEK